jgi:AraC-like DNA-binding protein
MNPFTDLLELIRLNVNVYHNARVCGDWQLNEYELGQTCFHMATQNSCVMVVPDHGEWQLNEGDLVLFPRELPHSLTPTNQQQGEHQHLPIAISQAIQGTSLLCGKVQFQHQGYSHLLDALPPVLVLSGEKAKQWLTPLTQLLVQESLRPDANHQSPVLNRLCELLISYALRCFVENADTTSVLSLYKDKHIVDVITAIHQNPAHKWQLTELAKLAAMSRTKFANYFKHISGWTPLQYITWWRMQLAYGLLQQGHTISQVAELVGYASDAALIRVFKLEFGVSPGKVRIKH